MLNRQLMAHRRRLADDLLQLLAGWWRPEPMGTHIILFFFGLMDSPNVVALAGPCNFTQYPRPQKGTKIMVHGSAINDQAPMCVSNTDGPNTGSKSAVSLFLNSKHCCLIRV